MANDTTNTMTNKTPTPRADYKAVTWGTIYYRYVCKGYDHSYAAFMADRWMKRKDNEHKTV